MQGIWAEAAFRFSQKLPLILLIVPLTTMLDLINAANEEHSGILTSFVWSVLAASVHNSILNGSSNLFPKFLSVLGVAGGWLLLTIPGGIAMVVTAEYLDSPDVHALIPSIALGVVTLPVASYFGTVIPASVKGREEQAFDKVAAKGKLVFGYTFTRLTLWICAALAAEYVIEAAAGYLGLPISEEATVATLLSPLSIVTTAVSNSVGAYFVVLLAVILSRSYVIADRHVA